MGSLHAAKEDEDLWVYLKQLTGFEDINRVKKWIERTLDDPFCSEVANNSIMYTDEKCAESICMSALEPGKRYCGDCGAARPLPGQHGYNFTAEEKALVNSTFIRWCKD